MRWCLLLGFLLTALTVWGQPTLVLPGKLPGSQMDIGPYTVFYEDKSGDTLPLSVIQNHPFRPFAEKRNERTTFSDQSVIVVWLRFTIRNTHPTDTLRFLYSTRVHGLITLYKNTEVVGRTGIGLPVQRRPNPLALPLFVLPQSEQTFHVRVLDYIWSPNPVYSEILSKGDHYEFYYQRFHLSDNLLLLTMGLLVGGMLFMGSYSLYTYLLARDRAYLFYTAYTGVSVLFALHAMNYRFGFNLLFPPRISDSLGPFHIALITAFYVLFVADLLDIRKASPVTWNVLRTLLVILAIQEVHAVAEWIYGKPFILDNTVYIYAMVPSGLATVILWYTTIRSQSPIRSYLLIGMASLICVSFIPGSLNLYFHNKHYVSSISDAFINYPYFWIIAGLAIEAICFLLALVYRGRLVELESRQIQSRYAHDLETQLTERTQQIEQQSRLLEQQHIRQLETEFERKLADTEMVALRAQMNPHFIFNCLNSIKLYTLQNDSEQASEFLSKFARLIRLVLENSRSELVTLRNELEALQLYIELEAMRFKEKLRYQISVSPEVDPQYLRIPPLLLQPFVENAIWHGLMHKPDGGTVTIEIRQPQDNLLHIEITDDGVGRAQATELKSKSAGKHKSFGMQVTADRIRMINQRYQIQTHTSILDLVDSYGDSAGTKVVLEIPV